MKLMKNAACLLVTIVVGCGTLWECGDNSVSVVSPDGRNEIRLWTETLAYVVQRDGVTLVAKTPIGLTVDDQKLRSCSAPAIRREKKAGTLVTPLYKKAEISLAGNEAFADFGVWGIRLVARNDGVAYRLETKMPGRIRVDGERAGVTIPDGGVACTFCYGKSFGCEETVPRAGRAEDVLTDGSANGGKFVYLPFAYSVGGKQVVVTESDVSDYPIWNLRRGGDGDGTSFESIFAGWPKKTHRAGGWDSKTPIASGGRWVIVDEHEDWLVETEGTRTFPWRTFVLADAPSAFCGADIVYALARGQALHDFSWVKPGKVAWDWWNAWDNQGEAVGCNTATYKRFVDFAAKSGVEYVILDEGWSESLNIWKFHPNVDVPEIIRYGKEKGVGVILWMAWAQIVGDEARVASHFAKLGARGFKVDFMDRGDAGCERFLWKFADECAKNRMLLDYHGVHRPTGMSRAYPNVLNYEGVHGLEQMKWHKNGYDFMANDVRQFFLRMTAGPMDYTPGAMDNYPIGKYAGTNCNPGSIGTRCHQMAMMVAYEAPLQMLCDAPGKYENNGESFAFMAATPVVWADTVGLGGSPDSYAAVARKAKDGSWYAAVLNDCTARTVTLDLSFLGTGTWTAESFRDAEDAAANPMRYVRERTAVMGGYRSIWLAPGGGAVIRFVRKLR